MTRKYAESLAAAITDELKDDVIVSAQNIHAVFDRDRWLEPDPYDDPEEFEDFEDTIYVDLNFDLVFSDDDSYTISQTDWAKGYLVYSEEMEYEIEVPEDVIVDAVLDHLIDDYLPDDSASSTYSVSGSARLCIIVADLEAYREDDGTYDLLDTHTFGCDIKKSKITDITVTKIG